VSSRAGATGVIHHGHVRVEHEGELIALGARLRVPLREWRLRARIHHGGSLPLCGSQQLEVGDGEYVRTILPRRVVSAATHLRVTQRVGTHQRHGVLLIKTELIHDEVHNLLATTLCVSMSSHRSVKHTRYTIDSSESEGNDIMRMKRRSSQ